MMAAATIQRHLYAAAAVVAPQGQCCEAAKRLEGQRFLTAEVPMLPLEGCTQSTNCPCKYQKFSDRRQETRRDMSHGAKDGKEQRDMGRGRRKYD